MPFCKSKDIDFINSDSYFGRQHECHIELINDCSILVSNWNFTPIKYWKEKKRKWCFKQYKCNDCGSEWWTQQYPKINDEEMLTMYDVNKLLGFDDISKLEEISI